MAEDNEGLRHGMKNPVFIISITILLGVFALIGAAIFGLDHGVLSSMANSEFARGLITYLFAVVTIGTAVVLVVSVLTSEVTQQTKERFDRGKEVLSLLLGVFGTIVGFYFGSEIGSAGHTEVASVHISTPLLSKQYALGGQTIKVTAAVTGGEPPYQFGVSMGDEKPLIRSFASKDGWIIKEVTLPQVRSETIIPLTVEVRDAAGKTDSSSANVAVSPADGAK